MLTFLAWVLLPFLAAALAISIKITYIAWSDWEKFKDLANRR